MDTESDPYTAGVSSGVDKKNASIAVTSGAYTSMQGWTRASCPAQGITWCVGGSSLLMWMVEGGEAVMEAAATAVSQQGTFGSP